jgi:pimeloyl-ACP methyl ester carboxylesterase
MKLAIAARQWLVHGAADDVVPPAFQSLITLSAKHKMKENARLVQIAGAGHFEVVDPRSGAWKDVESAPGRPAPLTPSLRRRSRACRASGERG